MIAHDSVEDYIAAQPTEIQALLERVRSTIRKAVPKADETITYKIPTYKLNGEVVIYFAAWKKHYSLYPASGPLIAELKEELAGYEIEKGTIRLTYLQPVPVKLIGRIVKFRAMEAHAMPKPENPSA